MSLSLTSRPSTGLSTWVAVKNPVVYKFTSTSFSGLTNYRIEVEVFKSSDNTSLTGGVKFSYSPNISGITIVDVSSIIKPYLTADWSLPSGDNESETTSIPFYIKYQELYDSSATSVIDDVANPINAVLAALQIPSVNGSNLLDYVPVDDESKWLMIADQGKIWPAFPFTTSFIWPSSISNISRKVLQYDAAGTLISERVRPLSNASAGYLTRLKLPTITSETTRLDLSLIGVGSTDVDGVTGFTNQSINTRKWLIAPYQFPSKLMNSGTFSVPIPISTAINIDISVMGSLKSVSVKLKHGATTYHTVSFGDLTTGTSTQSLTTTGSATIDTLEFSAEQDSTNLTGTINKIQITGALTSVSIPNPSFATATDWTNINNSSGPSWTFGSGHAQVSSSSIVSDSARSGPLGSVITTGNSVSGVVNVFSSGAKQGVLKIYLYNGSASELIDSIMVDVSGGVTTTYTYGGTANLTGHTNIEFTFQYGGGTVSAFRVEDITLLQGANYPVPNGNFVNPISSWTQSGVGYTWTHVSSPMTGALLTIPSPSFAVDFLTQEISDHIKKTVSITADSQIQYTINQTQIIDPLATGTFNLTINLKNSTTIIDAIPLAITAGDTSPIVGALVTSGAIDNIDIYCENATTDGETTITFINFVIQSDLIPISESYQFEVRDYCNGVCLYWKNSLGGDSFWVFENYHEVMPNLSTNKKAQRLTLFSENLRRDEWDAINELNSTALVYRNNIQELTSSTLKTHTQVGQQVYMINEDGSKVGVIVIPTQNKIFTKDSVYQIQITIELPETFL